MTDREKEDIKREAGLPDNWEPIDAEPIRPGQPTGAPPAPNAMSNYFQGSISPILQHDAYYVKTDYGTPGIPNNLLNPLGTSGNAESNAAIINAAAVTPVPPPKPTPVINMQLFQVNGNPDLLGVGLINGIPA